MIPRKATADVYQLRATLQGIRPPIWRRFQVPSQITFARLHLVMVAMFDWDGGHLMNRA